MADQRMTVTARYEADVTGYVSSMKAAATATDKLATSADKAGTATGKSADTAVKAMGRFESAVDKTKGKMSGLADEVRNSSQNMETAGATLTAAGAGLTAIGVGAAKAAMSWESAWAGVAKTNDGTAQQMKDLEQGLRDMTGVLPASHAEIAAVAEAAGQLGVGIDDVQGFTKVMIDLGESTNLSSEEAASALAKFSNIMGTALSDADRLGATIVGLGNNFATTEQDIVNMSMRLAGAGKQMGMSEADVMGIATAMSSVGIEAEAGGTAMTTVMKKIDGAVRGGGDALRGWADAAGVSAEQFASAWQSDPAMALEALTTGLAQSAASGEDMNQILADLGIKGIREADTLIRLAGAADETGKSMGLLGRAVEQGNDEWAKNTALIAEASKRYETAESKIKIAWNRIVDAAIDAGASILPAVAGIAEAVAGLADAFGGLPDWAKSGLGALAGAGGVALTAAGGFLMLAPRVVESVDAFKQLKTTAPGISGALGKAGKAAGIAAAAFVAMEITKGVLNSLVEFEQNIESAGNALLKFGETGDMASINEMFKLDNMVDGASNIQSFADALDALDPSTPNQHLASFGDTVLGLENPVAEARHNIEQMDQAFAAMEPATAAEQVNKLRQEMEAAGRTDLSSWSSLKELFPEYAASVEAAANATGKATSEADLFQAAMGNLPAHMKPAKDSMGEVAQAAEDAAESMDRMSTVDPDGAYGLAEAMGVLADESTEADEKLDGVLDALTRMGIVESNAIQATGDYAQAVRDLGEAYKENGQNLDVTTEKGKANMDALIGLRDAGLSLVEANANAGESIGTLRGNLTQTYTDLVSAAQQMGATAGEADYLARQILGIPEGVDIHTSMDDQARVIAEATGQAIDLIPGYKGVTIAVSEDGSVGSIQEKINSVTGKKETIFVSDDGTTEQVQQKIISVNGVERTVWVDDQGTVIATQKDIDAIRDTDVTAHVNANTGKAEADINHTSRDRIASVDALASVGAAEGSLAHLVRDREQRTFVTPFTAVAEGAFDQAARDRTQDSTAIAHTGEAEGEFSMLVRPREALVTAVAAIAGARAMLDSLSSPIRTPINAYVNSVSGMPSQGRGTVLLPGHATGGRLPYTGLGTDRILGVSSSGMPVARVDDGEWIIRESSARKYDRLLAAINRDDPKVRHLSGFATGGRVQGREWSGRALAPHVTVQAPSTSTDTAAIVAGVSAAVAQWRPQWRIGLHEFSGVMREANTYTRGR